MTLKLFVQFAALPSGGKILQNILKPKSSVWTTSGHCRPFPSGQFPGQAGHFPPRPTNPAAVSLQSPQTIPDMKTDGNVLRESEIRDVNVLAVGKSVAAAATR